MSSFRKYCQVARDDQQPLGKRYKSVRHAAERYSWLTRTSFESVFTDLRVRCGFRVGLPNEPAVVYAAATALECARDSFVGSLRVLSAARRVQKRSGRRVLTATQLAELYRTVSLGLPLARSPAAVASPPCADCAEAPGGISRPPPEFALGRGVKVVVNDRNRTPHAGIVRACIWHFKLDRWTYYLEEDGRKIHKRYFAADLSPVDGSAG